MHTTTTPANHNSARRIRSAIAAGAIGLLACGSLGACGTSTPGAKAGRSTTTVAAKSTTTVPAKPATTVQPSKAPSGGGSNGGGQPSGGNNGNPSGGGNTGTGGGTTTGTAPTLTSFYTPENIDCHNGNSQPFTMRWTTENATKVTISIDGPGIYDTYGPNGETTLPFSCTSSHSFLLTVFGTNGSQVTKQITLQPRNVQVPDTGDDDTSS